MEIQSCDLGSATRGWVGRAVCLPEAPTVTVVPTGEGRADKPSRRGAEIKTRGGGARTAKGPPPPGGTPSGSPPALRGDLVGHSSLRVGTF